jgi:hypothetical protein
MQNAFFLKKKFFKRIFLSLKLTTFFLNFKILTMSKRIAASFASASTSASASATTNTFSSSVQKGNEFEKKVLEKLKYVPKLQCNQVK